MQNFLHRTQHREQHFKTGNGFDGMGDIGGHENHLSCLQLIRISADIDFRFSVEQLNQGIEGSGVLTEFLSLIKGKKSNRPRLFV